MRDKDFPSIIKNSAQAQAREKGDETLRAEKVLASFFAEDSLSVKEKPICIIICGGIGSGKTTHRKEKYKTGYLVLDANEIFLRLKDNPEEMIEDVQDTVYDIGLKMAQKALGESRNFVVEVIGSEERDLAFIEGLRDLNYEIIIDAIDCDVEVARKRHLMAVEEDPDYLSIYFTEKIHIDWINKALENNPLAGSFDYYKKHFLEYSDEKLVAIFNDDVGNPGWVSARGNFLAALRDEFENRGFDISEIIQEGGMSMSHKVELLERKIVKL